MHNKVITIEGTITLEDGTTSQYSIDAGLGWQQWGASTRRLGETVDAMEAMVRGLGEDDILLDDDSQEG